MQKLRAISGTTGKEAAAEFGCSPAHISRVEQGTSKPSRELVQFYESRFDADGVLHSLFEVAVHSPEQQRRRTRNVSQARRALPGDASTFLADTVPHGTLMPPGQVFQQTWQVKNSGSIAWLGRRLERQGPLTGPGLISSLRHIEIPDTPPGRTATITAHLKAPTYDCSSIAYFKMIDSDGQLCFPDNYQLGLDVLVRVEGQIPDKRT
jgi:transcriptional regulator with XRE-family HTH domain